MCVVSNIGDQWSDHFKQQWPQIIPANPPYQPMSPIKIDYTASQVQPMVTRHEFEQLKKEVAEMKQLLINAKMIDEANGEPDCEMEEKVELLKKIAKLVGIDLSEVWPDA